jgi:hypothetical protein
MWSPEEAVGDEEEWSWAEAWGWQEAGARWIRKIGRLTAIQRSSHQEITKATWLRMKGRA